MIAPIPPIDPSLLQWLVNGLIAAVIFLLNRGYNKDQKVMEEKLATVQTQAAADRKETKEELSKAIAKLEAQTDRRFEELMARVEGKIDALSQETKEIGECISVVVTDIDWLKKQGHP